jgi:copper homeostasis protein
VKNIDESLEAIIECGFTTILTSGQEKNVVEGIVILSELVIKKKINCDYARRDYVHQILVY